MPAQFFIKAPATGPWVDIGWYSHYRPPHDGAINPKQWIADQKLDSSAPAKAGREILCIRLPRLQLQMDEGPNYLHAAGKEWGQGLDLTNRAKFGGKKMYRDYPFYLILNLAIGGNYFGVCLTERTQATRQERQKRPRRFHPLPPVHACRLGARLPEKKF